jgi:hypothetical protein
MYNIEYTLLEKIFDCVCYYYNNTINDVNNIFKSNNIQSNHIKNENVENVNNINIENVNNNETIINENNNKIIDYTITNDMILKKEIELNQKNKLIISNIDDELKKILNIFKYENSIQKIISKKEIFDGFNNNFKQYIHDDLYNKLKEMNQYLNIILKKNNLKINRLRFRKNKKTIYYFYLINI